MRLGGGPEKNLPTGGAPNSRHLPCTPGANTPGPWLSRSWPGGPVKAADYDTVAGALLATLEQAVENRTLVIDGTPQTHPLASDPHDHLVEVPAIARLRTLPA